PPSSALPPSLPDVVCALPPLPPSPTPLLSLPLSLTLSAPCFPACSRISLEQSVGAPPSLLQPLEPLEPVLQHRRLAASNAGRERVVEGSGLISHSFSSLTSYGFG